MTEAVLERNPWIRCAVPSPGEADKLWGKPFPTE